ncbi:MAG: hypothetical protein HQL25_02565 [Candidatus Omnitrophica bacterium]|nr:hypothetical protein [Candidatus Omnitrophota bacterium]
MEYYLATTGLSEYWDLESKKIFLISPWCARYKKNADLLLSYEHSYISSPWESPLAKKEAGEYCCQVYDRVLLKLTDVMNKIHGVSFSEQYWRILLGPWLIMFIEMFYDRYGRIKKAFLENEQLYSNVLPEDQCRLRIKDFYHFKQIFLYKNYKHYANLILSSLIIRKFFSSHMREKPYAMQAPDWDWGVRESHSVVYKIWKNIFGKKNVKGVFCDTYFFGRKDKAVLSSLLGINKLDWIEFNDLPVENLSKETREDMRSMIKLDDPRDVFEGFIFEEIGQWMPMCYLENYVAYRKNALDGCRLEHIKVIGSSVGWAPNEFLKFLAAEGTDKKIPLVEFQHGGGFGDFLFSSVEKISFEKDIFYSWGWHSKNGKTKVLPNPHLSKNVGVYDPTGAEEDILFIGTNFTIFSFRFLNWPFPEDMDSYFNSKKEFIMHLNDSLQKKILYRGYPVSQRDENGIDEYGMDEFSIVKGFFPNIRFLEGPGLLKKMKQVKLVVIDHCSTSLYEALVMNVPCVFYWDHNVYVLKAETDQYFQMLRDAGILHQSAEHAAEHINKIWEDVPGWWRRSDVQAAREKVCARYAYAKKDWMKDWVDEFKRLLTS